MNKKILLDVDEVVTFSGFVEAVNDFLGTNYVIDDFEDYYIDEVAIPEMLMDDFNKFLAGRNLYLDPHLLPGSIEVIKELNKYYDIYICSSCINPLNIDGCGRVFTDKYNFLRKYLPFLDPRKFIFTGDKTIFNMDIQIDDRINNFSNDVDMKILFPSYHNKYTSSELLKEKNILMPSRDYREGWYKIGNLLLEKDKILTKKL